MSMSMRMWRQRQALRRLLSFVYRVYLSSVVHGASSSSVETYIRVSHYPGEIDKPRNAKQSAAKGTDGLQEQVARHEKKKNGTKETSVRARKKPHERDEIAPNPQIDRPSVALSPRGEERGCKLTAMHPEGWVGGWVVVGCRRREEETRDGCARCVPLTTLGCVPVGDTRVHTYTPRHVFYYCITYSTYMYT